MVESRTTRMAGLPQWSNKPVDGPTMEDFNECFLDIDQNAAMFAQGALSARPAAGIRGRFYFVTGDSTSSNNGRLYYDDGAAWTLAADPQQRALIIAQANPIGVVELFAGPSAPTGWLFCQGQSYPTTTYPELFDVLQYTYGGSGGLFNLPDLRDRVPVGAGGAKTVGARGGVSGAQQTLGITNIPAHTHSIAAHKHTTDSHAHNIDHYHGLQVNTNSNTTVSGNQNRVTNISGNLFGGTYTSGPNAVSSGPGGGGNTSDAPASNSGSTGGSGSSGSGGSGAAATAFDIQNPYLAMNYIIKAVPT